MLWILAAASIAATAPAPGLRAAPQAAAQASVRIIRAPEIRFGKASPPATLVRQSQVRESDGSLRRASLIEFY